MKVIRKRGDTSNILQVFLQDSSSTTGAGLTGLVFNTSSLTAYYHRDLDTTATAISLVTMTVGTFTSSGFKEIDSTNMPGWYQFCPPDAAFGSGTAAHSVAFHIKGATNLAPCPIECQLVAVDVEDTVRLGLTAMPNVASGSAGAIITSGTGTAQLSVGSGLVTLAAVTHTGAVIPTVTTTTTATNLTNAPTAGDLTATMKTSVTTACTASTPTAAAVTGAVGSVTAAVSVTGDLSATMKTSVTTACTASTPTAAAVTGAVGSVTGAVGSVTLVSAGAIGATSVSTAGQNASADAFLERVMSAGVDSGGDNTTARTVRQALRTVRNKVSIAAGTMTVTKEDDSTACYTASVTTTAGNPISAVDPT